MEALAKVSIAGKFSRVELFRVMRVAVGLLQICSKKISAESEGNGYLWFDK